MYPKTTSSPPEKALFPAVATSGSPIKSSIPVNSIADKWPIRIERLHRNLPFPCIRRVHLDLKRRTRLYTMNTNNFIVNTICLMKCQTHKQFYFYQHHGLREPMG
ncbi:hypothetical protein HanRHA438_Chr16g0779211 [Helianthus annuus]|nr:hypothetical protein HanRHA438_Chr16g0779211 [Helianthus annuus]